MRFIKNKYFILSFFFTLLIIFFTAAMLYVDFVNRSVLLNDDSPIFSIETDGESRFLRIFAFGTVFRFNISLFHKLLNGIFNFICIIS